MEVLAELAGVTVRRGQTFLIDGLDLTICDGQRWVIIGPNGAGKTTLLQLLAAQLYPTLGMMELLDEYVGAVDVFELRPRIGFASAALADRLPKGESVQNVVMSAAHGVVGRWREEYEDVDVARAAQLLAALGAQHLAERTFGTLSEGERKRVQIARALMTDPELLLLDEPAAGLDLAGRETLVAALSDLCLDPDAPTTVLVTHHLEEIPQGITHALILAGGKKVAAGPVEETLTDLYLSTAFGVNLRVERRDGRWSGRSVAKHG
ncbi:MAG: iron ABC transporter ATP-binding protein [Arachnia propionica]|nr:MAG: iron ABC transporter ATP-binding protein [Arachnia propionica]